MPRPSVCNKLGFNKLGFSSRFNPLSKSEDIIEFCFSIDSALSCACCTIASMDSFTALFTMVSPACWANVVWTKCSSILCTSWCTQLQTQWSRPTMPAESAVKAVLTVAPIATSTKTSLFLKMRFYLTSLLSALYFTSGSVAVRRGNTQLYGADNS